MRPGKLLVFGGFAALALLTIVREGGSERIVRETQVLMGTAVEITVAHRSEKQGREAIAAAMREIRRVEGLMSHHKPESQVSKLNREGSSGKIPLDQEVFQVIREAVEIGRASRGAFDVTILPLSSLWGFDDGGMVPERSLIERALPLVGLDGLIIDENSTQVGFLKNGMGLDLGAIAKGWAVDLAAGILAGHGIRNAIVDAGGDLRVIGARPGRKAWRIGVQHPREPGALLFSLDVTDAAIVTSGDYERFFIADGVRYHHILDPATGQPARGCQSVTVLAPTAAEADACATAAFVLGPEAGLAFLRSRAGVRGVIVAADGTLHWSDEGLRALAGQ